MGTNMRMHVEKRVGGQWVHVPDPTAPPAKPAVARDGLPASYFEPCPHDWYDSRLLQCYDLMAVLGDARNYDGFKPIAAWRGLPEDVTDEVRVASEWGSEVYPTWLLVSEIKAYDFDQMVSKPARLYSADEIQQLGWLGNGPGQSYLDISRRDHYGKYRDGHTPQDFPVRQFVAQFLDEHLPEIEKAAGVPPEDIRLVLLFS